MKLSELCEAMGSKTPVMRGDDVVIIEAVDVGDSTARFKSGGGVEWVKWHEFSAADAETIAMYRVKHEAKDAKIASAVDALKAIHLTLPRVRYTDEHARYVREDRVNMDHRLVAIQGNGGVIIVTLDTDGQLVGRDADITTDDIVFI